MINQLTRYPLFIYIYCIFSFNHFETLLQTSKESTQKIKQIYTLIYSAQNQFTNNTIDNNSYNEYHQTHSYHIQTLIPALLSNDLSIRSHLCTLLQTRLYFTFQILYTLSRISKIQSLVAGLYSTISGLNLELASQVGAFGQLLHVHRFYFY